MNDLNKWKEGAELLASLPKESRCDEFSDRAVKRFKHYDEDLNPINKNEYDVFVCSRNLKLSTEQFIGPALRVDDFAELDSRKFLENCGISISTGLCSVMLDFGLKETLYQKMTSELSGRSPIFSELDYFLTIIEIAKKAWIENLPEWKEIWFKGFKGDK